eukprot:TRINITY_DN35232_c0_g1_i2.p1 TRINITY_DN35232_c0_g1~~TRINITY_DN35232_c0_g1_i2.p1  ORF type:complete len:275 (+),score=0.52 TRINITY_DN35232_c0_g1_i2:315-1139(+)
MGTVFGRIEVETPKFDVEVKRPAFEIRRYPPQMAAQVTYDGDHFQRVGSREGFFALAGYIGVMTAPQNRKPSADEPQSIAMTAPVITHTVEEGAVNENSSDKGGDKATAAGADASAGQSIAMTAPVITHTVAAGGGEAIAMTAPVITATTTTDAHTPAAAPPPRTTMQFLLPASFTPANTPAPTNPAVSVVQVPARHVAALRFSGLTTAAVLGEKAGELRRAVEAEGGWKIVGDYVLARYNDPFTIPMFRTNEILYPVEREGGEGEKGGEKAAA